MINIKNSDIRLRRSSSLVMTYPRTVQITCGHYPEVADIHNFIIEIKKNVSEEMSYATNVKGGMTDWNYFVSHPLFNKFMTYVINTNQMSNPELFQYFFDRKKIQNAWGNIIKKNDYVHIHDHSTHHGILYLTKGNPLILPELDLEIHPEPGDYYVFPPFIKHYVDVSNEDTTRYNLIFNIEQDTDWKKEKEKEKYKKK
jgi:hypothetical protein